MSRRESIRIGNFSWITPSIALAAVASIAVLAGVAWCWFQSLSAAGPPQWIVAFLATIVGVPFALAAACWAMSRYVLWVEIGEDLTFCTLFECNSVAWRAVEGIEFQIDQKTVGLPLIPLQVVVGEKWIAVISLANGRQLPGYINFDDMQVLGRLLTEQPRLDTHCRQALSTPRSTMTTFVDAVMEDEMHYASRFLDLSKLPEHGTVDVIPVIARTLKQVIDDIWYIDYEEIPDDPEHPSPYILASGSDQEISGDLLPLLQRISMFHDPHSGYWRFHPDTVLMIANDFTGSKVSVKSDRQ